MDRAAIEQLCETGQQELMQTHYREAEAALSKAENAALAAGDWDAIARLYLPLQEARRQRRQKCGEGIVCLDLLAEGPVDQIDPRHVVEHYPHGQLLVAGWGSIDAAAQVRAMAATHRLYLETFLAAVYPTDGAPVVVIVPLEDVKLPDPDPRPLAELVGQLPPRCVVLGESELPQGPHRADHQSYARVMALWERLHAPFLAAADTQPNPIDRIQGYRKTIRVDYACELAHQRLAAVAHELSRLTAPTT